MLVHVQAGSVYAGVCGRKKAQPPPSDPVQACFQSSRSLPARLPPPDRLPERPLSKNKSQQKLKLLLCGGDEEPFRMT